jgi:serine/threonine protein kinase
MPTSEVKALATIAADIVFRDWEYISEGTHATVYKVIASDGESEGTFCVKLFGSEWMTTYNFETTAYEHLQHAEVEGCIPRVYGCGIRTLSEWGLVDVVVNTKGDEDIVFYGILMEWLEGAEQLSDDNITMDLAVSVANGLAKIHDAGVYHGDARARNILVYPETNRAVWIDFSCAMLDWEHFHESEMKSAGSIGLQYVLRLLILC